MIYLIFKGPEEGVRAIFHHARNNAPCILVIEDLDSLVTPEVRSFFLNEIDGLVSLSSTLVIRELIVFLCRAKMKAS